MGGEIDLDAVGQAEAVRRGDVTPVEMVEQAIERRDPALNALCYTLFDDARTAAARALPDGPLRGVPILLKDSALAAGQPLSLGVRPLHEAGARSPIDDNVVSRLRGAGAVLVGRTNVPELLNQGTTEPALHGPTRNPWDLGRSAGGSSGGSAAAVAARMVAAAHGNDGGGSIRIPASACGLVGLKASRGRVSTAPLPELPGSTAVEGMLCRSVRDAAALLDVLCGPVAGDPHPLPAPDRPFATEVGADPGALRVCVMPQSLDGLTTDPACVTVVKAVADVLVELGHVVSDAPPRLPTADRMLDDLLLQWSISAAVLSRQISQLIGRPIEPHEHEPINEALIEHARSMRALDLTASNGWRAAVSRSLAVWWSGHDILLTSTMRTPPRRLGEVVQDTGDPLADWARQFTLFPLTAWWNMTGQPAISLPLGTSDDGLPIGVQLVAAHGREDQLLQVSAQLEQAMPWQDRVPPAN